MLTKDLIRARLVGGAVRPGFIAIDDPTALAMAEQLLHVYGMTPPPRRADVAEAVQPVIAGARDPRLARGLDKVLLDRCDFGQVTACDYPECRRILFRAAAARLAAGELTDDAEYRQEILAAADLPAGFGVDDIYADLPENERIERFRSLGAQALLQRYNVALVQALLLRAESLDVTVSSPDPAKMRRLFKYLRFFRLLARMHLVPVPDATSGAGESPEAVRLTIEGPGSVLSQPKRYGLQLASFFPAVCALDAWSLATTVEWKGSPRRLRLTETSGLVSHYRTFSAYVPEEIRLFHQHFAATVTTWHIVGQTPFLRVGGAEVVFPDLSFEGDNGTVVHLELFHRWHAGPLLQRLQALARDPDLPLIVGVDRSLLTNPAVAEACEQSVWFQTRGFLFRDYPTVERSVKCLQQAAVAGITGGERR